MADEEMEMAIDFGHAGFAEDIDIDLDFPAGQPDEDMDLGDFDRVHGVHNFNSDTRDELMAEGDDSSYNMIDAIETDHNASAAAANDIDIDLEHAVESIWQQDPPHSAGFHIDTEIDYLDEATAETMDAEGNNTETNEWAPLAMHSPNTNVIDHVEAVPEGISIGAQEPQEELHLDEPASSPGEPSGSIKLPYPDAETTSLPAALSPKQDEQSEYVNALPNDEKDEAVAQPSKQASVADQDETGVDQPGADDTDVQPHSPNVNLQEFDEQQEAGDVNETTRAQFDHDGEALGSHNIGQLEHTKAKEPSSTSEDHIDLSQPDEADKSAGDALEYELGGELYLDTADDPAAVDDAASQVGSSEPGLSDPQSAESNAARDLEAYQTEVAANIGTETPNAGASDRDDPIELASHYGVYISYGETNYQLFSKSEHDDPNHYFLTDQSVLDLPLAQFLTSLREVVSEEVSPLDELVMQVDGLGLEFSESTSPEFLGKFTFGDLVVLYDKLVKNEQAESSPPIYTYLTVKPNFSRRMMALGESANAGRGLSEVALYHDSVEEEQVNRLETPDTDFSTAEYNDGESGSIYPQEDGEEADAFNNGEQQGSPLVNVEVQSEHPTDLDDEADELDHGDDEVSVSGSINAADYEEEAGISGQDHATSVSSVLRSQDTGKDGNQHSPKTSEASVDQPKLQTPKTMPAISATDAPNSENTSVTATLDGEDHDEIDYNSDGDNENGRESVDESSVEKQSSEAKSDLNVSVSVDDEITWESDEEEEEEVKDETKSGLTRDIAQVSPVSGKRARSDSDTFDGADDKNGNKRRRS
ncbi:putative conserved glutamic acid-rich protein [Rosellinia necatrix]|uniref:Putative conserved glutamic acid-rich protein n=1 Tax=Rosellinia necatrix TaxID=77044 RepID=A0A1W2TEH4_ROSNE|nr:putative conserved glutamic acid-rich protein [Rosellinia necatrix]